MHGIQEIDAAGLGQWVKEGQKVRLIDVRTPQEVAQGVIAGADFIPMHMIPLSPIELDADEKLVIYCRSGARSAQVCMFLAQQGKEAYNLRGGIISWASAGLPIASPESSKMAG
jgi:rhodanese-related sulfurtransferase